MSKGSRTRPREVPHQQFRDNWDAIFGKKPREPEPKPPGKTPVTK
jgi:hypothetical protein